MSTFDPRSPGNVFDSREVLDAISEREQEIDAASEQDPCESCEATGPGSHAPECELLEDLHAMRGLIDAAGSEASYGATFIADSYFATYAQDFAEDIGAISADAAWPATCIDWDQAARELQMDYTSADLFGDTYWVR